MSDVIDLTFSDDEGSGGAPASPSLHPEEAADVVDLTGDGGSSDEDAAAAAAPAAKRARLAGGPCPAPPPAPPRAPGAFARPTTLATAQRYRRAEPAAGAATNAEPLPRSNPPPAPRAQPPSRRVDDAGARPDRLLEALSFPLLFSPTPPLLPLPKTFGSHRAHAASFEAALFEETREGVRSAWDAERAGGRVSRVRLAGVRGEGRWRTATLEFVPAASGRAQGEPAQHAFPDASLVVLSSNDTAAAPAPPGHARPPHGHHRRHSLQFVVFVERCAHSSAAPNGGGGGGGGESHPKPRAPAHVRFYIPPRPSQRCLLSDGDSSDGGSGGGGGGDSDSDDGGGGDLMPRLDASVAGEQAAHDALESALRDGARVWVAACAGRLGAAAAEFAALRNVPQFLQPALLDPRKCAAAAAAVPAAAAPPLPCDVPRGAFLLHLRSEFNGQQNTAIAAVAAAGDAVMHPRPGHGGSSHAAAAAANPSPASPRFPFTLVQGPPGTGKTHALWGMLNVLHLMALSRERASILAAYRRPPPPPPAADSSAAAPPPPPPPPPRPPPDRSDDDVAAASAAVAARLAAAKPRFLVCAPSNAAVDVTLSRVATNRFVGPDGTKYAPPLARLAPSDDADDGGSGGGARGGRRGGGGGGASMAPPPAALPLLPPPRCGRAEPPPLDGGGTDVGRRVAALERAGRDALASRRSDLIAELRPLLATIFDDPRPDDDTLASACRRLRPAACELFRVDVILGAAFLPAKGRRPPRLATRDREAIEISLLHDADVVFTTLGSAGRSVVARLRRFALVLVDEAAQAAEPSCLVALSRACHSPGCAVVLVGDPKQLPSTVLSPAAKAAGLGVSLFERLVACGVAPVLLTTQHRMHPDISAWPSSAFYNSALVASPCVLARPRQAFYDTPPLHSFCFFDASGGRAAQAPASTSLLNTREAEAAAALYLRLAGAVASPSSHGGGGGGASSATAADALASRVAVLTPYRGQVAEIARVFRSVCGAEAAAALAARGGITTVDGAQGSERDIIILSLVRTHSHNGDAAAAANSAAGGFVDDPQRCCVGLTRARHACWVIGSAAALGGSTHWGPLIAHAKATGRFFAAP